MLHAMGVFLKRLASIVVVAGGWLFAGVRTTLDLVGWSTAPDDVDTAMSRLDQLFVWILGLPWWVPWGFALVATLWLMWVSWPRHLLLSAPAQPVGTLPLTVNVQQSPAADAALIPLPWQPELRIDCTQGKAFHIILLGETTFRAPINPREGSYRIYVVQGPGRTKFISLAAELEMYANQVLQFDHRPGGVTVCEIDVLRTDSGFKHYFKILNTTANEQVYDDIWVGADEFKPNVKEGCKVFKAPSQAGLDRTYLSFPHGKDSSATAVIHIPRTWMGRRVKFQLDQTVYKAESGDAISFEIDLISYPHGGFKCSIPIVIHHTGKGFPQVWSEPSKPIGHYDGRPYAVTIRRMAAEGGNDSWTAAVNVEWLHILLSPAE